MYIYIYICIISILYIYIYHIYIYTVYTTPTIPKETDPSYLPLFSSSPKISPGHGFISHGVRASWNRLVHPEGKSGMIRRTVGALTQCLFISCEAELPRL